MNIFATFILLGIGISNTNCYVFQAPTTNRFSIEAMTQQIVETIRKTIVNGDQNLGIPVLDPFTFNFTQFNYSGEILSVDTSFSNGQLTGLSSFQLTDIKLFKEEIAIGFDLSIPSLTFYSEHYSLDGNINDVMPIKGEGMMRIEVNNITLWGKIFLKQSKDGKAILLDKNEDTGFHIETISSQIQFDNNIDDIINTMVQDRLADYLNRSNKLIAATISDLAIQALNPTLEKFETWEIITTILSLLEQ